MLRPFAAALTILVFSVVTPARSQPTGDTANQVMALANHIAETRELLESRDPATRDAAVEVALRDPSPAIRGMAIYYALRRYPQLPLQFNLPAGSSLKREDLPQITLSNLNWESDGRAFRAVSGASSHSSQVQGQITADRLRLQFRTLRFSSELAGAATRRSGREDRPVDLPGCEAELAPANGRESLLGVLRCPGLSIQPPLLLPLG